jgi:hypothetical protein
MRELLVGGKNTIDPEVIDPGGQSVEDSPVKSDFPFYVQAIHSECRVCKLKMLYTFNIFVSLFSGYASKFVVLAKIYVTF